MEIKLTSDMFEQGTISNLIGGSLSQAKSDTDNFIRSKELIPVLSERKITLSGNPSGLDVRFVEFDKDQKMIAANVWKSFGWSWDLNFDTVYIAFIMAIPGGQSITRPFMVDTLSRIEPESEWRSIVLNEWSGLYYQGDQQDLGCKTLTQWGLKAGDTITFSTRIKTNSGKKCSARIEWHNSANDRISVYGNIIQNGEGVSTVTATIPSGFSSVYLFVDCHETLTELPTSTTEQVKDGVLILGSNLSNLDRGGVLTMSNYPDLPIVTDESGFEYAEGMNLWKGSGTETFDGALGTWNRELKDDTSVPSGKYARCTLSVKSAQFPQWGVYGVGTKYREYFVKNAPMTLSLYARASREISFTMTVEFAGAGKPVNLTTQWQKIEASVVCIRTPEDTSSLAVCFYSPNWNVGDYIDLSSPMLTYGKKFHPYRPNPTDLVGGGGYLWLL